MKKLFVLSFIFIFSILTYGEYNIKNEKNEYGIGYEKDGVYRMLTFYKEDSEKNFSKLRYRISKMKVVDMYFEEEIKVIEKLWNEAMPNIKIELKGMSVGYPEQYDDVLTVYIDSFLQSKEWKKSMDKKDKVLMREIIVKEKIYRNLEKFLMVKGYKIKSCTSEKHGFIKKEELSKRGKNENEKILMPYMLWFNLENLK